MSSLVRRIQKMPRRASVGAKKRMFGLHVGDKLGLNLETPPVHPRSLREKKK